VHSAVEIAGSPGHVDPGRRIDRLYIDHRCLRSILIYDIYPQVPDDGVAEGRRKKCKGEERNHDHEQQRHPVTPYPNRFADRDAENAGTNGRRHQRFPLQAA
jgi:hypothetical protein